MELSDVGKQMLEDWDRSLTKWEKFVLHLAWLIPQCLLSKQSKQKILRIMIEPATRLSPEEIISREADKR